MIRWLIAAYILTVLVFSAKAMAFVHMDSNPTLSKFNDQTESSKTLDVQDPLPSVQQEDSRPVNLDSISENSVG